MKFCEPEVREMPLYVHVLFSDVSDLAPIATAGGRRLLDGAETIWTDMLVLSST